MSDQQNEANQAAAIETLKTYRDGSGIVQLDRTLDGRSISIYIKNPMLADVIRKMSDGHALVTDYSPIYKPILKTIPNHADRNYTKPAVSRVTANFIADAGFDWETPRAVLVYNADALEQGFTLTYKVDTPIPMSKYRAWGEKVRNGCRDIIANARPFRMTWVMREKTDNDPPIPPPTPTQTRDIFQDEDPDAPF